MVKSRPRISRTKSLKRKRSFESIHHPKYSNFLKSLTCLPFHHHHHQQQQEENPATVMVSSNSKQTTTTTTKIQHRKTPTKSPFTPRSKLMKKKSKKLRRLSSTTSPSFSATTTTPLSKTSETQPSLSKTPPSLSTTPPTTCLHCSSSSASADTTSASVLMGFASPHSKIRTFSRPPLSPDYSSPPPLPPSTSPQLLRRTLSEPVPLSSDSSGGTGSATKRVRIMNQDTISPTFTYSATLEGYLPPPLPPPPSPEFLRRTVSDPAPLLSDLTRNQLSATKEVKVEEVRVETMKLSEEWVVVKCNCECGKYYKFLINGADKKCHMLSH